MLFGGSGCLFFFFNDTATTEIYTLSLHDALPIWPRMAGAVPGSAHPRSAVARVGWARWVGSDRKSTRLNSSHVSISYAVFCLKKKKKTNTTVCKATLERRLPVTDLKFLLADHA